MLRRKEKKKKKKKKNNAQISCAVIAQLISVVVFATQTVQSTPLFTKSEISSIYFVCSAWFVSDMVRNPDCLFSYASAHIGTCRVKILVYSVIQPIHVDCHHMREREREREGERERERENKIGRN